MLELDDGLEVAPLLELEGLELVWLELEPEAPLCWPASHSERLICPSWLVSSLSKRSSLRDELEEDDVPPEAELGLVEDEVPPADDEDGEDDLLLCDMDGEDDAPELLFESPAA
ncbi:MAG TPA: hypothetical protein VE935_13230 [Burkholderiales bacterium]|nr:hypothetical protein [Burkholderiales bacterium]